MLPSISPRLCSDQHQLSSHCLVWHGPVEGPTWLRFITIELCHHRHLHDFTFSFSCQSIYITAEEIRIRSFRLSPTRPLPLPPLLSPVTDWESMCLDCCGQLPNQLLSSLFASSWPCIPPIHVSSGSFSSLAISDGRIPCCVVTDSSVYSTAPTKVDVIKALGLLHSNENDKLPSISHWAEHGTWPHNLPAMRIANPIQPNIYRICQFLHFAAPCIAFHINDHLAYGVVDSGSKALLISKPYLDQVSPATKISSYLGRPFRQADSSPLPVLGECRCTLQIGTISSEETLIIFEAPPSHKECLIGFEYLNSKNIFIGPDGLYIFPSSVLQPSSVQQHFPRSVLGKGAPVRKVCQSPNPSDFNAHGDLLPPRAKGRGTANGDISFPIYACEATTVLPYQTLLIKCRLQGLTTDQMCHFASGHMVCSSERLEPYEALTRLSVYFQLIPITEHNQTIDLLYYNNQHDPAFINEQQVIAHCEPMRLADDQEMEVFSRMKPACYFVGAVSGAPQADVSSLKSPDFSRFEFDPNEGSPSITNENANVCCSDPIYKEKFLQLVKQYSSVYGNSPWSVNSWGSEFELKARESQVPFQAPVIPCSPKIRRQAAAIISTLLSKGHIQYSKSPYRNSVLFLVKKSAKDDINPKSEIPMSNIRMVLDLRRMSAQLVQNWPGTALPHITDVLGYLRGMKVVSVQDFSQGFFGIKLAPAGRHLTAFQFSNALFEFCSLPQGTSPASAVFQRAVAHLLQTNKLDPDSRRDAAGHVMSGAVNFVDDLVIFSRDLPSHYQLLSEVFQVLKANNIKLKLSKAIIAEEKSLSLLGYEVNLKLGTIGPARKHIDRLLRLKHPTTLKGVRRIIGSFQFFSSLIPNFSSHMAPLFDMLRVGQKFNFGQKEKAAFDFMVTSLAKFPTVYIIDVTKAIYTICDAAAGDSICYILMQFSASLNSFIPCRFVSHRLNRTQQNYAQVQAECLSLSTFCSENYSLLLYRQNFIYNDSHCLSYISHFRYHNVAIFRHHLLISSLNLRFIWLSSSCNVVHMCDLLTRPALKRRQSDQQVLRQRISRELIDKLPFVNMENMPEMSYKEAIDLLDKFNSLCDKLGPKNLAEKWQALLKVAMPAPAPLSVKSQGLNINVYFSTNNNISQQDFLQCCTRINTYSSSYEYDYPSSGEGVTNKVYVCTPAPPSYVPAQPSQPPPPEGYLTQGARGGHRGGQRGGQRGDKLPREDAANSKQLPPRPQPTLSCPNSQSIPRKGIAAFQQAEGKLAFYFPGCKLSQLISEQKKDDKLQQLAEHHPHEYKRIKGVICKLVTYKGITYLPVAWPQHLAVLLLQRAHVINSVLHLRRHRLEQHLKPFFFVRNFNKMFEAMNCSFCLHTLKHKQNQIPLGLSFNVSQTKSFLSIDVCVVNSNIEFGSFLNIVDVCSYFCIAVKCRATPTAQEVHELIWTNWCQWAGVPISLSFDNGINASLGHDIAQHFNCREFFITPLNSKGAAVEHVHSLLLHVCRGASMMGYITGDSFQLWLSLAALLHNSTRNINGVAPSQLMFLGPPTRINQFIGLSDLQHQQTRSYFVEMMREASQFLSLVALKRKELNLKKAEKWQTYRQKIHCGDLVLRLRTEVKKALWKLRPRYRDKVYRVVATRRNYCILLPLSSFLSYVSSPFHKGKKPVQKYERADRKFLKLIPDPYEHLGLTKARQHIEAAVSVLGQHQPVQRITFGPPNSASKTNHPFYRLFANPYPQSTFGPPSVHQDRLERQSNQTNLCFSEDPPFLQQLRSNRTNIDNFVRLVNTHVDLDKISSPFLTLEGNTHYVFLQSCFSWERSHVSKSSAPTVPYNYTAVYKEDRLRRVRNRMAYLRDAATQSSHQSARGGASTAAPHSEDQVANDPLFTLTDKQLTNVSKAFLHLKKSDIFSLVMSSLDKLLHDPVVSLGSSSSSPSPLRSSSYPPPSRAQSPASIRSSSPSMHSVQSGNGAASHVTGSSVASNTESDVDTVKDVDDVNGQDDQDDHPVANPAISPAPLQGAADGSKDGATRTHVVPDVTKDVQGADRHVVTALAPPITTGGSHYHDISDLTPKTSKSKRRNQPPSPPLQLLSRSPPFTPRDRALSRSPLTPSEAQAAASPLSTPLPAPTTKSSHTRSSLRLRSRKNE